MLVNVSLYTMSIHNHMYCIYIILCTYNYILAGRWTVRVHYRCSARYR